MVNEITEELLEKIRKFPERYRVIEQNPLEHYLDIRGDEVRFEPIVFKKDLANNPQNKHMVILDTETTGIKTSDEIIELAFVTITYNVENNCIVSIDKVFDKFREPVNNAISDSITKITGITAEMVRGKSLSYDDFKDYLPTDKYLIVAHNASFDRKFVEKTFPELKGKPWADSLTEVDWLSKGATKHSLEMLMYNIGLFYNAHRAVNDVLALLAVLVRTRSLQELDMSANNATLEIEIAVAFDSKDTVKQYGFRWNNDNKTWKRLYKKLDTWNNDKAVLMKSCNGFKLVSCKVQRADTRYA